MKYKIILASASKRRSKILKECGIPHRVVISNVPEKIDHKRGARFNVLRNARVKAEKIADRYRQGFGITKYSRCTAKIAQSNFLVIGADTVVLSGKRLIGKPKTAKEARSLLGTFSGKTILVYTGLYVIDVKKGKSASGIDVSKVRVRRLSREKQDKFIKISGPYDKAGGFSIEGPGAFIFDNIEGSFYNVLGLPVMKLYKLFEKLGVDLLGMEDTHARI
ncbi:MAG: septum formation protein Maf [Candidatus Omnitrophica bacterium]|nr:septum formation protein Maf [Candidatus Omnitrophota bacterium]